MTTPYWTDGQVSLYLGDCREVTEWQAADVLVMDPPYGVGWGSGDWNGRSNPSGRTGIAGDQDTTLRDDVLTAWGSRPALVFGSLRASYPTGWRRMLVFRKPTTASGIFGNRLPWLTNWEPIFALGEWPDQTPMRDAVVSTSALAAAGWSGYVTRYGHPHAKPVDVMEALITACPPGVIADPFAGSGSTLVAARDLSRKAIGVEIHEPYAEMAARRLSQAVLPMGAA